MPIIKNAEVHFCKLDPKRPNAKFNKANPTWDVQLRTTDKEVKKQWEQMKLAPKPVMVDDEFAYWRVNLRKKSVKKDGEKADPVKVVDGKNREIDPTSIGNGSIANIRIFQYEYDKEGSKEKGTATILMAMQIVRHVVYVPKPREDEFGETETETIQPEGAQENPAAGGDDDGDDAY